MLQRQALAASFTRVYDGSWAMWCRYRQSAGLPLWLPMDNSEEQSLQLVAFAIHCARRTRNPSSPPSFDTVCAKLSHISWHHCVRFGRRPQLHEGHRIALRGLRRNLAGRRRNAKRRAPAPLAILNELAAAIDFNNPYHRVVFGAAVMGFFFLMRRSEYLCVDQARHPYCLRVSDVQVLDTNGRPTLNHELASIVVVNFRGSKSDQLFDSCSHCLHKSGSHPVCPVLAAPLMLQNAKPGLRRPALYTAGLDSPHSENSHARSSIGGVKSQRLELSQAIRYVSAVPRLCSRTELQQRQSSTTSIPSRAYELYTRVTNTQERPIAIQMTGSGSTRQHLPLSQ